MLAFNGAARKFVVSFYERRRRFGAAAQLSL